MPSALPHGFNAPAFFRLALPMIVSRAGLAAMDIADGIMVARYSPHQFAWLSMAEGTLARILDIFIAFLIGGLSLVPRHFSQGDATGARIIWLRTIPVALALGGVSIVVTLFGTLFLSLLGQKPELASGAGAVTALLGAGYPAALLAISAALYLEGINQPKLVAVSVVAANLLNLVFNWVLIGGHLGFHAMGARGSALSTTLVRWLLCFTLVGGAWLLHSASSLPVNADDYATERAMSKRSQWKLGLSAATTVSVMVVLSSSLTVFAGWLGTLPLAVFAASWSVASPAGLVALGMADAAGIYVASEGGRAGDRSAAAVAWASLRVTLAPVTVLVSGLFIGAGSLAAMYTKDTAMRMAMGSVIPIVALIVLADCAGFVMASSLRSVRESGWPASIEIGSMLLLVPLALSLAIRNGYGIRGLFVAMLCTSCLRAGALALRFWWRTRSAAVNPDAPVHDWSFNAE